MHRRYWPLALILVILTSISFISHAKRNRLVDITVTVKGIPEHGLILIGRGDPSFEQDLSSARPDRGRELPQAAKVLTAVLANSTHLAVVGYHLKWNFVHTSGKVTSQEQSDIDPTLLMEHRWKERQNYGGSAIGPESTRLVSVVPFLNGNQANGALGGMFLPSVSTVDVDSVKRAIQDRNTGELANNLIDNLAHVVSVTVSIDGAFFEDGTFVGPDENQFFLKVKAQVDARHDLYGHLQKMVSANKPHQKILQYATDLANAPRVHLGRDSTPSQFYDFFRSLYGQEIMRMWNKVGEEAVLHRIEKAMREPWPSLRKL